MILLPHFLHTYVSKSYYLFICKMTGVQTQLPVGGKKVAEMRRPAWGPTGKDENGD